MSTRSKPRPTVRTDVEREWKAARWWAHAAQVVVFVAMLAGVAAPVVAVPHAGVAAAAALGSVALGSSMLAVLSFVLWRVERGRPVSAAGS